MRFIHGIRALAAAARAGRSARRSPPTRARRIACCGLGACGACAALVLSLAGLVVAPVAAVVGDLVHPLSAVAPMTCPGLVASQGFGNTPWEHPHTGIDLVCPSGTAVVAVRDGIAHDIHSPAIPCVYPHGRAGGLGIAVELDSGGIQFVYGHLATTRITDGQSVQADEVLGTEGMTGCATGPHLHFEVHYAGAIVNPCPLLPGGYPATHDSVNSRCWGNAPP